MRMPSSLVSLFVVLVICFLVLIVGAKTTKAKEKEYMTVPGYNPFEAPHSSHAIVEQASAGPYPIYNNGSYQHSNPDHYSLPEKQKEVTYCVIDGRLVD